MLRLFFSFLIVSILFPVPSFAKEIETDSTLKAATVYTNRATLTRQAVIDVPKGASTIVFTGLPANLMVDSLRAEGSAVADVVFGALSHKHVMESDLTVPREKELNKQIEDLQDQRRLFVAEKQALSAKNSFAQKLGNHASSRTNEEIADFNLKPAEWGAAMDVIQNTVADVEKGQIALDIKIRDTDREINKLRGELNQMRTGQRSTYQVSIPLEASAATSLTVDLMYQIPGASWRPLYDARLDTENGDLSIVQYGAVRQNSGEDWHDVKLTLSTAQPHRGAGLPALNPMWVNVWEAGSGGRGVMQKIRRGREMQSNLMARAPMAEGFSMDMADEMEEVAAAPKAAQFAAATINTGGFVSEYVIAGLSEVKADGTESKLLVGAFETDSKVQIQIKPQLSTAAFLVARTKLKGEAPILPGQVSLFRDGAYVGQSHFPLLRPGEEQDLSFGVDDQVSAKRHVLMDEASEDGIISKDNNREKHFVTEIQNLHSRAVEVVVLETTPVSQNEKLRVEIVKEATTQGYEKDADKVKGLLRWVMNMTPKQKSDVKLGWKVSWPKDHHISGL